MKTLFFILLLILQIPSNPIGLKPKNNPNQKKYLLTGHTYSWLRHWKVDKRIEDITLDNYFDGYFLGGDILSESLISTENLDYLDDLFSLSDPMTHIAIGNHDARNGNISYFNQLRNREASYYSHVQDGLSILVLNTTLDPMDCYNLNRQDQLLYSVCDTIQKGTNLILLMHDAIWENVPGIPHPKKYAHGSQKYWNTNCNSSKNYFYNTWYPALVKVRKRGVRVICMMGDTGWKKGGSYTSSDGIEFISSGINNTYYMKKAPHRLAKVKKDKVYVITHDIDSNQLDFEVVILDSLAQFIKIN